MLLDNTDFRVVGALKNGTEVTPFVQAELVDIILLDLGLPDIHGLTILTELVGVYDASVIVLSGELDAAKCDTALKMGARAVVSKSDPSSQIVHALHEVQNGRTYCSPEIKTLLDAQQSLSVELSPRQMAILHFFAKGETNKEIGYRLRIAAPTVSFHLREIREKVGVEHNRKIVEKARAIGLI